MTAVPDAVPADARATARVLVEALPYIHRFRGARIVVKYGGHAMVDPELARRFAEDISLMWSVGMQPIVVHGGGPQIGELMGRLGKRPEFRDGLRVTDAETLDIARMVLVGKVNREIVNAINVHRPVAVGLSGEDAGLITATARDPALGFVGDVTEVDPTIIDKLLAEQLIPVISSIGRDAAGQAYNINADTAAGAIAGAVGARRLIHLTDVAGLLADPSDPGTLIRQLTLDELDGLLERGVVGGGMIPKIASCVEALRHGVDAAHLLDGRIAHVLLLELFTDRGVGTMIRAERPT